MHITLSDYQLTAMFSTGILKRKFSRIFICVADVCHLSFDSGKLKSEAKRKSWAFWISKFAADLHTFWQILYGWTVKMYANPRRILKSEHNNLFLVFSLFERYTEKKIKRINVNVKLLQRILPKKPTVFPRT
jgi:hypothetical protein